MTNRPLSSTDQLQVIFFLLLAAVAAVGLVGIPPVVFIAIGWYMMNARRSFDYLETAIKATKVYALLVAGALLLLALNFALVRVQGPFSLASILMGFRTHDAQFCLLLAGVPTLYWMFASAFFQKPLRAHATWVAEHGIFASTPRTPSVPPAIIQNAAQPPQPSLSGADELLKWAKLKEDGHITEAQFTEVRDRLISRP